MKRIYRKLAERQARLLKRTKVAAASIDTRYIIISVGVATFFFGFFAGAILNLFLLAINNPLVHQFRSSLSYKSAIFGDGILLPLINMLAVSFILKNRELLSAKVYQLALLIGMGVTVWFHVNQAMQRVVNWAMPVPWQWNILGLWHAIYMFAVCSLLSLFLLVVIRYVREEKEVPKEAVIVLVGVIFFFILLRLDYINLNLISLIPGHR